MFLRTQNNNLLNLNNMDNISIQKIYKESGREIKKVYIIAMKNEFKYDIGEYNNISEALNIIYQIYNEIAQGTKILSL